MEDKEIKIKLLELKYDKSKVEFFGVAGILLTLTIATGTIYKQNIELAVILLFGASIISLVFMITWFFYFKDYNRLERELKKH